MFHLASIKIAFYANFFVLSGSWIPSRSINYLIPLGPCLLVLIAYFKIIAAEVSGTSGVRWNCTCSFTHQGTKESIVAANCSTSCDCERGNCHLILFWSLVCIVRVEDIDKIQYFSIIDLYDLWSVQLLIIISYFICHLPECILMQSFLIYGCTTTTTTTTILNLGPAYARYEESQM